MTRAKSFKRAALPGIVSRRALSGVGATDDEALLNLRTRIQEGSDEG